MPQLAKPNTFASAHDWIEALSQDLPVSIIPNKIAAELLGDTAASISKRLGNGGIEFVEIGGRRYVSADAIANQLASENALSSMIRIELEDIAKKGGKIFYSELMEKFGMRWQSPPDRTKIGQILGNISKATYAERGVFLSVLVHRKNGKPTNPGPGYFALLDELERTLTGFHYDAKDSNLIPKHMKEVWASYDEEE